MDELKLVERLRSEVPEDIDVTGAERQWRRRALGGAARRQVPWRPILVSGLATATCGGVLAVAVLSGRDTPARPMGNVAAVLTQAADQTAHDPTPGPGQIVYQETVDRRRVGGTGRWYRIRTETWLPVEGAATGLVRQRNSIRPGPGEQLPPDGEITLGPCPAAPPIERPYLGGLPADPDALLRLLAGEGEGPRGERMWSAASDLIDRPAPPRVRAALYRAIAEIPGVRLRTDAVDAAGRPGVAITRTQDGVRDELIFDRTTHRFLGTRTVITESGNPLGAPGTVTASSALLRTAIVDHAPTPGPNAEPGNC
ncbi:CU044_5270 family protein [Actinomadura formosensis]|uniref:CU044_5270 family protein n=1 Tax=Actinomadura formosensis TaxID=60706 RepID=UPI003D8BC450